MLVASVLVVVLLALGLLWFFFWRESPSRVLVSTIMSANAGHYSAAEDRVLPETMSALNSKIGSQLIWDGITKKGTVKNVTVLNEQIRGEGATVRISIAYEDGASGQAEETLRKVDGKWKLSLMGLMQVSLSRALSAAKNPAGFVPPDPQNPLESGRSRVLPATSKQVLRAPTVAKIPAATQSEPVLQRNGDEYKQAVEKLAQFKGAGDDETRSRIAKELADLAGKWTKDESSQVIDAVAKLGAAGKPLARLLCQIIANGPLTAHSIQADPVRRNALATLESVHPDLYQPAVATTIDSRLGSSYEQATKKLASLGDKSVSPILLKHLRDGVKRAESSTGPFSYSRSAFVGCMDALVAIGRDEPATFDAILAIPNAWAKASDSYNRGAKNFSYDNLPIAVAAVKILGRFGPEAKEAVPLLKQLKLDENVTMRQAASDALKAIDGKE